MKKILATMIALFLSVLVVQAQGDASEGKVETAEKVEGLDISQAFPDEEIEHKMEMKGMKVYNYMLSHKFTALQEKLGQFLGESWVLEDAEVQAQAMAEAQKQIDAQGMKILGMVTFKNVEKPSSMVMLMQMALPSATEEGDVQAMVTLTHLDM
ncbi:MAG: hypothetical protein ACPIA7_03225 [Akkermansiaceae bacterium]